MSACAVRAARAGGMSRNFLLVLKVSLHAKGGLIHYNHDVVGIFNPLPDDTILDWSKLKQSADDNFKFDENSRKFSKRVENTVGKGEIARYEQFLLFPQCFLKAWLVSQGRQKVSLCGNGLNHSQASH